MEAGSDLSGLMEQALAALKSGHAKRACEMLRAHLGEGANNGRFLALLGAACCLSGHPEDGVPALERSLELAPSAHAHFNLGQAYQMAGDLEKAQRCYEHALALDPTYQLAIQALDSLAPPEAPAPDLGHHIELTEDIQLSEHAHLLTDPSSAFEDSAAEPGQEPPLPWIPPPVTDEQA